MARKIEIFENIFSTSPRDDFISLSVNSQNRLSFIPNPYIGNKRKMLADLGILLYDTIGIEKINSVCDLFAGSSVVSAFFQSLGCTVSCNDLLASSYLNAVCLLQGHKHSINKEEWLFLTKNKNSSKSDFIQAKYAKERFTIEESEFIDNFYANCIEMFGIPITSNGDRAILDDCKFIKSAIAHTSLIHFIMTYCFVGGRLNNGQILASLTHRLEHQRNNNSAMSFNKLKPFAYTNKGGEASCSHKDVFDFLKQKNHFDLVYIDPPYGGQQSDYAFMYQMFEEYLTQTNFDKIEYLKDDSKKFAKTKTYEDNFAELLTALPDSIWVISYNNSSWADIDKITDMVRKHKKNIQLKEIDYSYKYRTADNSSGLEYIIIGQ